MKQRVRSWAVGRLTERWQFMVWTYSYEEAVVEWSKPDSGCKDYYEYA